MLGKTETRPKLRQDNDQEPDPDPDHEQDQGSKVKQGKNGKKEK